MTTSLPPGPKRALPGADLLAYRRDPLGLFARMACEHGDVSHARLGAYHVVLLAHPDDIRDLLVTHHRTFHKGPALQTMKVLLGEGLLTSEGEFHLRQRRLAQPAFHRGRVHAYGEAMARHALEMRGAWRAGQSVDMAQEMSRLTLGVVAETLFGSRVGREADEVLAALTAVLGYFDLLLLPGVQLLFRLPTPWTRRYRNAQARLDRTIYRLIAARRANPADRGDLLSLLLHAQEEGEGMTDRQLRDEALTIFLAGQETTANALTWTWYLLSRNPAVEERLHAELDAVLGGRTPTADDYAGLPYTKMVISESMRLYPPAWAVGRRATAPYDVRGYALPAGTVFIASQWVTHRDARWFPEPERFDPERWTPNAEAARPKFSYFPFGGGSRVCIGEGFAWMEGVLLLAALAQAWRPRLASGHPVEPRALVTLRPRHGMRMTLERRA
jgi:cytochrome P450